MSARDRDRLDPSDRETRRLSVRPASRHVYGAAPMGVVLTAALGGPVVALVLLIAGRPLDALVVALVGLTLAALFAAEAWEALLNGPVTRAACTAAAVSRERAALAGSATTAWSKRTIELARLQARRRRLERRATRFMCELGEAIYANDHSSAAAAAARARASAARTLIAQTDRVSASLRSDRPR